MKRSVERWRQTVEKELSRQGIPLPVIVILSLIDVESNGVPGLVNAKSGASGLMQVMPRTLEDYNRNHPGQTVALSEMQSKDAGEKQIRVGLSVLASFWKNAYRYLKSRLSEVDVFDLSRIADLFYVAGPSATKKRLDKLAVPSYHAVVERFPKWNALPHPKNVFDNIEPVWDLTAIDPWLEANIKRNKTLVGSALIYLLLAVAGYWLFLRPKNRGDQS